MVLSIFDLYTIGVGPSSSHTVGPMKAAKKFVEDLQSKSLFEKVISLRVELFGSLALTGRGHGTHKAIIAGLNGQAPETVDPDLIPKLMDHATNQNEVNLLGLKKIFFNMKSDFLFKRKEFLKYHSNGMRFSAFDEKGKEVHHTVYYSTGGGFILSEEEALQKNKSKKESSHVEIPFPYETVKKFLTKGKEKGLNSLSQMILENEKTWRSEEEIFQKLDHLWASKRLFKEAVSKRCSSRWA